MNYQWYPGHMAKARRMMEENIKLIDLMIELVDARIPLSSRNPDIDGMARGKSRIILLNKSDLADPEGNSKWVRYFEKKEIPVLELNSKTGAGVKSIQGLVRKACSERIEKNRRKGIVNRPVRAMVVGIPNVGKSTFINAFTGKACTKTGNKPGVTKGKQWIRLNKNLELLDTPGILWPKFEDRETGKKLAFIGSMNDEAIVVEELACDFLDWVRKSYPNALSERYGIRFSGEEEDEKAYVLLKKIAVTRGCYKKGEEPDLERAAVLLMEDFRSGRLGRMTLELPDE